MVLSAEKRKDTKKSNFPGDVVDLPESYLGESWLEPLKEPKKPEPKHEPVKSEETAVLEAVSEEAAIPATLKFRRRKH